ncbi:PorT family protein [Flammeovirga pectinis]|uniref:PorT family protein n=1 Tax=Flammeovirga pectinis TaxID=2494373 RepID=A0A3Q9FQV0_9BACT|nr:porin family protein [Flammeovirga pectinis]AZQ62445.1 PorT family protein [Flammeovirga pectinis]
MKISKILAVLFCTAFFTSPLFAQEEAPSRFRFGGRLGFNLGASVPMYFQNMPDRFSWNTGFNPSFGLVGEYKLKKERSSIHFELLYTRKGNSTTAHVVDQNFFISNTLASVTGEVATNINLNYIEIPIQFKTNISKKDNGLYVVAGLYFAYMVDGSFDGTVFTGSTIKDSSGEYQVGKDTPYDYSNDLVNFDWGTQFGIQKEIGDHFTVDTQISWGFSGIFPQGYEIVDPNLFNLYGKIGMTYKL